MLILMKILIIISWINFGDDILLERSFPGLNTRGLMEPSVFILKPRRHFRITWNLRSPVSSHIILWSHVEFGGQLVLSPHTTFRVFILINEPFYS